ncbi:serine/threonine-protein kinase [Streptomyces jumonjinensis]|uniref:serine/threonine-protein kinase n=1 Tax=Streptomyces jumonjinensis TaxID=1945 RepID=UPI0037BC8626
MSGGESGRRVIDGRFALETRLGGGGMGTVWRARDLVLDRAVALKEVRPPDPGLAEYDPESALLLRARVLREARALARVDHPNVVTIHHIVDGGESTYPWLVMELVTGGSLQDRLARGPMEPARAARVGREVLAALRAAHHAGIQHRDVKPANVLLRPDGRPVLTDFGIAAIRESTVLTATGSMIGTPDYMAPERITGDDGGPGADLWSLAMMLYVAVEGRHPLRRGTTLATLAAVLYDPLPPPVRAGALAGVLGAVLVRDPAARPDAETVDRMLAAVVRGDADPPVQPGTTSYRLSPPAAAPPAGPSAAQDAAPRPAAAGPASADERPGRRSRRVAIGSSILGMVLTGVLMWTLPLGDADGDSSPSASSGGAGADSRTPSARPSGTPSASRPGQDAPKETATGKGKGKAEAADLLTPGGIRAALKELKAEMGTDRVGYLVVYPGYLLARGMVEGSDKRYDTYTYYVGQGVSRSSNSGSLVGGNLPVSLDAFDWDALPPLLKRAENDLNVEKPTLRYLSIRQPNELFNTPAAMAVYLSDAYSSGYLEADADGRVTRVTPAGS